MTPLSVRTRREVERRTEALCREWGEFAVEPETAQNDPDFFESGVEMVESGHVGAAGALVHDADGRVLLGFHTGEDVWGWPGGGHEPGETLAETAYREVREETSIEIELTGVWFATRRRFVHREDPERRAYLLEVVFTARADEGGRPADASEDDEIARAGWFAPPAWPRPITPELESRTLPGSR